MTNWQKFKIIEVCTEDQSFGFITFGLERFHYDMGYINCVNDYPINTCQVGDYLEVDVDRLSKSSHNGTLDANVARKFGSSAVVPSSSSNQQITSNQIQERDERMRRWVEESGGEYETDFIAREEYRDGRVSAREMKWTYRKK